MQDRRERAHVRGRLVAEARAEAAEDRRAVLPEHEPLRRDCAVREGATVAGIERVDAGEPRARVGDDARGDVRRQAAARVEQVAQRSARPVGLDDGDGAADGLESVDRHDVRVPHAGGGLGVARERGDADWVVGDASGREREDDRARRAGAIHGEGAAEARGRRQRRDDFEAIGRGHRAESTP